MEIDQIIAWILLANIMGIYAILGSDDCFSACADGCPVYSVGDALPGTSNG